MALIANLALLLNMARRLSFAIAQSITIVGWLVASSLLIALVSVASTSSFRLEPRERHALTQAYYYAIMAAALYFIVSILMILTVVGAYRGHYEKEFRLTLVQRTLMLQTIAFMMYLLIGACIFSYVEDWRFLDAVYWSDFTLLTVGIGSDFVPKTHLGRSLLFPYAVGGIVTVGLVIGSIRSLVLERGKAKMTARMTEKRRENVLGSANLERRTIKVNTFRTVSFSQKDLTEPQRREQEFNIMRKIQSQANSRRKWMALGLSTIAAMTLWLVGAVVFRVAERKQGWSYFVSLYFSYTSLLTIGYGDLQPTSNSGKPFFVLWSLLAVPTLTVLISNMGDTVVKSIADLVNWTGTLTILPGENGMKAAWRSGLQALAKRLPGGFHMMLPGKAFGDKANAFSEEKKQPSVQQHAFDKLSKYIEDSQLDEAREAGKHGDSHQRDHHLYLYVLSKEIRHLMKDVNESPPKTYSYHDWAWYLKLLGQDERDRSNHRDPPIEPDQKREDAKNEREYLGQGGGTNGELTWSWLGTRSPLMGNKSEAEWLLESLSTALERELYNMHSNSGPRRRAPISFNDVLKKEKEHNEAASETEDVKDAAEGKRGSSESDNSKQNNDSDDSDSEAPDDTSDSDGDKESMTSYSGDGGDDSGDSDDAGDSNDSDSDSNDDSDDEDGGDDEDESEDPDGDDDGGEETEDQRERSLQWE
jgi:potassium channel subfamily K